MFVDMHCHSVSSDDARATVEQYLKWIQVLRKRGYQVDAIVLTEHRKFDFDADYAYGTGQGSFWPNEADETIEFTDITDSGLGSCPAGYHDLYNITPNEMLMTGNTVLAFISCDVASSTFHGDDVIANIGSGTQSSWCTDVGPYEAANNATGDAEAISLMVMDYGALNNIGTFNYYISGDGNYYWGHLGMLMKDAANYTDPLYGMWGDYVHIVHWVFVI